MSQDFIDELIQEIIKPGLQSLMDTPYFSELRQGKLSIKRLQGFALQHYITNVALNKGFALCMVKYAHDADLYKHFAYQYNEEQYHPDLVKRFGLALGLKEDDFQSALFIFECLSHTGAALRGMLAGSPFSAAHLFRQTGPFRASNLVRTRDNVVLAGCGTVPGVGVPTVLLSGRLAAARITGEARRAHTR